MPAGRVLGLDLGEARIGVALSDPEGKVALPFGTIPTGAPQDVKAIAALVKEHEVTAIVVGHPLAMSGRATAAADHAETFAHALGQFLGLPVHLQDERLTTVQAERGLREGGLSGRDRRRVVDQAAAALILQAFLDRRRTEQERA
jgi:putative Holliday junction resolvase